MLKSLNLQMYTLSHKAVFSRILLCRNTHDQVVKKKKCFRNFTSIYTHMLMSFVQCPFLHWVVFLLNKKVFQKLLKSLSYLMQMLFSKLWFALFFSCRSFKSCEFIISGCLMVNISAIDSGKKSVCARVCVLGREREGVNKW